VAVLVCDGVPDCEGEVFRKDGVEVPEHDVPVTLEFGTGIESIVGKAKLRWVDNILFADVELLPARMKENGPKVLYPAIAGLCIEKRDKLIYKSAIRGIGLSVGKNADGRIGTLHAQGVR
jgi:hypothetical protein